MNTVTLQEVLESRDRRRACQQQMLQRHRCPLISFTVNMPGDIKDCHASRVAFDRGLKGIKEQLYKQQWTCLEQFIEQKSTGPFALLALQVSEAKGVKRAMMSLENTHPLGRLFDLDVVDASGRILSRRAFGDSARKCLVCDQDAVLCARTQKHDIQQLRSHIERLVATCG